MGFDIKTTTKIVDNLGEFIKYLDKFLKLKPNLLEKNKKIISNLDVKSKESSELEQYDLTKFKGKIIVFTGFRPKDIILELEKKGSKITDSISKNTNFLIAMDPNEKSNKITKAKELDIKILSKDEFYKIISKT